MAVQLASGERSSGAGPLHERLEELDEDAKAEVVSGVLAALFDRLPAAVKLKKPLELFEEQDLCDIGMLRMLSDRDLSG